MPTYAQADRPLILTTPLGKDVLLPIGFQGHEAISELFSFQLDLLAESQSAVRFDRILGQNVTVEIRLLNGDKRYFNGLVKRFSQGGRDDNDFLHYRAEVVPKFWLLTKTVRSRVFQHFSVPEILHRVLTGLDVSYQISGTYYQRDYCVQYRESDFQFASRLMEEEGIYYFFKHSNGNHQMIVTDHATPTLTGQSTAIYEEVSGGMREDMRVTAWEKTQELRSGEYTLWDHCFELPTNHLEGKQKTVESVVVGKVTHKLKVGGNDQLEIYDYPGGYAQRFDGVDRHGTPQPPNLEHIFQDRDRTVKVRMEQEQAVSLEIQGAGDCGQFTAGHKFTLERHFDGDGQYLLTRIEHDARLGGNYRTDDTMPFRYENRFTCIPATLRYRAQSVTRKPAIAGFQTATVVGPQGPDIFCDQYGRVKVQFHWDREGKKDVESSCWLRVAQVWAGKNWGAFFWPRIGNEVVVTFEEGDPDQPLIIGSVYNRDNMPPFELPKKNHLGGIKSESFRGKPFENFNGIVFNDKKGHEHLAIHSERHMSFNAEFDKVFHGGRNKGERVAVANVFTVGHFPSGGGSGGGPKINEPLGKPLAQGLVGLNSTMVYGENILTAVGINHQLVLGSNYQVCINPVGLLSGVASMPALPLIASGLGGGIGGNVQFTIGTNAQITYGRNFEINVGAPKVELNNGHDSENTLSYLLCGVMGLLVLAYVVCYGIFDDDDVRADMTIVFQSVLDLAFGVLVCLEGMKAQTGPDGEAAEKIRKTVFSFKHVDWTVPTTVSAISPSEGGGVKIEWDSGFFGLSPTAWELIGAVPAVLGAAVLPLVVAAQNEHSGDDDVLTGPTPASKVD